MYLVHLLPLFLNSGMVMDLPPIHNVVPNKDLDLSVHREGHTPKRRKEKGTLQLAVAQEESLRTLVVGSLGSCQPSP